MLKMQQTMGRPFLVLLCLPATAMGFALSVQISVLSWLLSTRYGLRIDDIGFVWAAGPLAGILGQVAVGIISDRVWVLNGRRRVFILAGSTTAALMIMALPNIGTISRALGFHSILGVAIAVSLALDLAINVSFNPTRSIISNVTVEGPMRTRGYTWMQSISGLFGVLAYAIGALWGNDALIYIAVGVVLAFSILPALLITEPRILPGGRDPRTPAAAASPPPRRGLMAVLLPLWAFLAYDIVAMGRRLLGLRENDFLLAALCLGATFALLAVTLSARDRGEEFVREDLVEFRKILAAHAFSWIGVQTMFVYMISFVHARFPAVAADRSGAMLAISFLVLNAVGAAAPAFALEPLTRRLGPVAVHSMCLAAMSAGFLGVYLFAYTPTVLYAFMALMGLGWAAIVSLPFAIMSSRVQPARIGFYMGIFNLSVVIPQLFVSLGVGAYVARSTDSGIVFLIGAATLALSAVCWLFVRRTTETVTAGVTTTAARAAH